MSRRNKKGEDIGFANIGGSFTQRSINKDGSFNVLKSGNRSFLKDLFHYLISIELYKLLVLLILYYVVINLIFGLVYYSLGMHHFTIRHSGSEVSDFLNSLFFSFQTFATVGYGYISPISVIANVVVIIEIFMGMLSVALLAGLVYSRFSMPNTRILFSDNLLLHEKDPKYTTLKFKIVNKRDSIMIDTEAIVTAAIFNPKNNTLRYYNLDLVVKNITFLPLTWTVHHIIDKESPLYGITKENYKDMHPEILIRIKGFDDKYHQNVYANFSYHVEDWVWNKKFERNFWQGQDGIMHLNVMDVHKYN